MSKSGFLSNKIPSRPWKIQVLLRASDLKLGGATLVCISHNNMAQLKQLKATALVTINREKKRLKRSYNFILVRSYTNLVGILIHPPKRTLSKLFYVILYHIIGECYISVFDAIFFSFSTNKYNVPVVYYVCFMLPLASITIYIQNNK